MRRTEERTAYHLLLGKGNFFGSDGERGAGRNKGEGSRRSKEEGSREGWRGGNKWKSGKPGVENGAEKGRHESKC